MSEFIFPEKDLGETNYCCEGSYRRGYHQAVAEIAFQLHHRNLSADELDAWVEGCGMTWRKDVTRERKIVAPEI